MYTPRMSDEDVDHRVYEVFALHMSILERVSVCLKKVMGSRGRPDPCVPVSTESL